MTKTIFLAHASNDKQRVRSLFNELKTMNFDPWMDESDLPPGAEWESHIQLAIKKAKLFFICFSDQLLPVSSYVHTEIRLALEEVTKREHETAYIIPILLDDIPISRLDTGQYKLSKYQAIRYFSPNGKDKLFAFLEQFLQVSLAESLAPKFARIKELVSHARTERAINELENIIKTDAALELFQNPIFMLKNQHSKLKQDEMIGIIAFNDASVQRNRIVFNLLNLLNEISSFSNGTE
ncbi:TIR domain-containing protein [Flavilitoribacter nigricans]|uniref:Uncharacterized protein n=1 Tax=Flavilitoribacter nigricans (strain ATCC 23147 / DSM 23189 / NBRC 102662 / NCIMB 1420 / SS-2) TaxID=1122177 RepID=A0A2D0N4G2_FLAN2|nr:TIR domain-containing protein [Flavilitoribacter nigricans]PHN03442.1 hypothetical protein CRP01_27565 [Flavilitoribacter nigricans DSM 23189 = NBRC 102662]